METHSLSSSPTWRPSSDWEIGHLNYNLYILIGMQKGGGLGKLSQKENPASKRHLKPILCMFVCESAHVHVCEWMWQTL